MAMGGEALNQWESSATLRNSAESRNISEVEIIKFGKSIDMSEEKRNARSQGKLSSSSLKSKVKPLTTMGNKVRRKGSHFT